MYLPYLIQIKAIACTEKEETRGIKGWEKVIGLRDREGREREQYRV
jgi:hypothetical protein